MRAVHGTLVATLDLLALLILIEKPLSEPELGSIFQLKVPRRTQPIKLNSTQFVGAVKIPKGHTRTHQKFNELEQRSSRTHFWSSATIYCLREADQKPIISKNK